MKINVLFPNKLRPLGWILLIPSAILGYFAVFKDFEFAFLDLKVLSFLHTPWNDMEAVCKVIENNITQELAGIFFIVGALLAAFSKEKIEDEYISKIRLESLLWAVYATFIIQIVCLIFLYDMAFLYSMIVNMFTLLIVFIIRYNFIIYRSKSRNDDK
ncbi:MAG: hypothetical protein LBC98_04120 [Prevotellaceae bacterium]|jgi:hypothetical protein|nr:hypothetical protein [Prevotellaceae bacterium]